MKIYKLSCCIEYL